MSKVALLTSCSEQYQNDEIGAEKLNPRWWTEPEKYSISQ